MADYLTFENIYQTVMKAIGDAQYSRSDEVKAIVNMIYLNEICQCDDLYPLFWLYDVDDDKRSKDPITDITSITKATPPVVTTTAVHGRSTGDVETFYSVVGMTELNYRMCHITVLTTKTFSLQDLTKTDIAGAGYGAAGTTGKSHNRGILLTSCQEVLKPNWHGYDPMDPVGPGELADSTTWLDVTTSLPTKYMHRKVLTAAGAQYDYLLWYPAANDAYWLYLPYVKHPARLSATTDVPILPPQFHDAIIAGAVTRLGVNAVQVEAGVIWPSIYKMYLDAIREYNRKWWAQYKPSERSELYLI